MVRASSIESDGGEAAGEADKGTNKMATVARSDAAFIIIDWVDLKLTRLELLVFKDCRVVLRGGNVKDSSACYGNVNEH